MDLARIRMRTATSTKATGTATLSRAWAHITTPTATSTRVSGREADPTAKETTSTRAVRPFTRATGSTARSRVLEN